MATTTPTPRVETAAYVDKFATPTGSFRYGLVFRAEGGPAAPRQRCRQPPTGELLRVRDRPRAQRWELLHDDTLPQRPVLDGPLPAGVKVTDSGAPDRLKVDMRGDQMTLSINGQVVGQFNTRGFHLTGDLGLYVETIDETKPHVHFDELKITPL